MIFSDRDANELSYYQYISSMTIIDGKKKLRKSKKTPTNKKHLWTPRYLFIRKTIMKNGIHLKVSQDTHNCIYAAG